MVCAGTSGVLARAACAQTTVLPKHCLLCCNTSKTQQRGCCTAVYTATSVHTASNGTGLAVQTEV